MYQIQDSEPRKSNDDGSLTTNNCSSLVPAEPIVTYTSVTPLPAVTSTSVTPLPTVTYTSVTPLPTVIVPTTSAVPNVRVSTVGGCDRRRAKEHRN